MSQIVNIVHHSTTQMSVSRRDQTMPEYEFIKCLQLLMKLAWLVLLPMGVMSCVIPPPLALDLPDAGANSPPVILSIRDEATKDLTEPGPVIFSRGTGTVSVTLLETDAADNSYVRVFIDYNRPDATSARAACLAAATSQPRRTVTCDVGGVCQQADVGNERLMWIEVFDREPLDTGTPRFRAMPTDGLSTHWQFFLRCQEPQI